MNVKKLFHRFNHADSRSEFFRSSWAKKFAFLLVIVLISFGVYSNILSHSFVWDDNFEILHNPWIRDVQYIPNILFSQSLGWLQPAQSSTKYGPLKLLIRFLQYQVSGTEPWLYLLTNVLVHVACSVMVYFVAARLFLTFNRDSSPALPFVAALLFAVHPIHTEPVNWVIGLSELSMTLFSLLTFLLFIQAKDRRIRDSIALGCCFFLALAFKITALFCLVLFVAYDYAAARRDRKALSLKGFPWESGLRRYAPFLAAVTVYFTLYFIVIAGETEPLKMDHIRLGAYDLLLNIPLLFSQYLWKLLFPAHLTALYVFHPVTSAAELSFILPACLMVLFIAFLVVTARKNLLLFLCAVWIAVPLIPCLYLPATGYSFYVFAERYLYLPSAGYVIAVSATLQMLVHLTPLNKWPRAVLIIIVGAITIGFSYSAFQRNTVWTNDYTLWTDTIKKSPDSAVAHNNLGIELERFGQFDMALNEYELAIAQNSIYMDAYENRFRVLNILERRTEALK